MAIELSTGNPGAGKTLSVVQEINVLSKKWEKKPEQARPIFVLGIKDLALSVCDVPTYTFNETKGGRVGHDQIGIDWESMPDGSLVIIDECQKYFPKRPTGARIPEHVAFLNVHRHRGFDIWLITQKPKNIDIEVRELAGRHRHYRRNWATASAVCYEWDGCSVNLNYKESQKSAFKYPKDAYKFYKSAEVHTKPRNKFPIKLLFPLVGIAFGAFFIPDAYSVIKNGINGKPLVQKEKPQQVNEKSKDSAQLLASADHEVKKQTETEEHVFNVPKLPSYAACISNATKCVCYTHNGIMIENPPLCRESTQKMGILVRLPQKREEKETLSYAASN